MILNHCKFDCTRICQPFNLQIIPKHPSSICLHSRKNGDCKSFEFHYFGCFNWSNHICIVRAHGYRRVCITNVSLYSCPSASFRESVSLLNYCTSHKSHTKCCNKILTKKRVMALLLKHTLLTFVSLQQTVMSSSGPNNNRTVAFCSQMSGISASRIWSSRHLKAPIRKQRLKFMIFEKKYFLSTFLLKTLLFPHLSMGFFPHFSLETPTFSSLF